MNIIKKVINKYIYWKEILQSRNLSLTACKGHKVKIYNWTRIVPQDLFLVNFIEKRGLLDNKPKTKVALYSIFGPAWLTRIDNADCRIFVARENLHKPSMRYWEHQFIDDNRFKLSLGFDEIEHPQYLRHPFWLMWDVFDPTDNYDDIKRKIEYMNSADNKSFDDRRFCSFLCSHDDGGRKRVYDSFSRIDKVDCDGRLFHNNDTLKSIHNDNKLEYLRDYRFNLTPENTDYPGYCTEKLVEAIYAGCIPIYNGSNNNPEPNVFNRDAIVFINMREDNTNAVSFIEELNSDKNKYLEFACQRRFVDGAADVIWDYYTRLENKLIEIIKNS